MQQLNMQNAVSQFTIHLKQSIKQTFNCKQIIEPEQQNLLWLAATI